MLIPMILKFQLEAKWQRHPNSTMFLVRFWRIIEKCRNNSDQIIWLLSHNGCEIIPPSEMKRKRNDSQNGSHYIFAWMSSQKYNKETTKVRFSVNKSKVFKLWYVISVRTCAISCACLSAQWNVYALFSVFISIFIPVKPHSASVDNSSEAPKMKN